MSTLSSLPGQYSPGKNTLEDRKIIVTGAASDLGHAISLFLASHGAELVFIERKERLVSDLYDLVVANGFREPLTVAFDLQKNGVEQLPQLSATLATEFSAIDGIIHLATSAAPLSPLHLSKPDVWQAFYETVTLKPMWLTTALLPLLEAASKPAVVFPAMSSGETGRAYWGPVGAAFAATRNIVETFASEQSGIRFNSLSPGRVSSNVRHKYYPGEAKSALRECSDRLILLHYLYLLDPAIAQTGKHFRVPDR